MVFVFPGEVSPKLGPYGHFLNVTLWEACHAFLATLKIRDVVGMVVQQCSDLQRLLEY